MADSIGRFTRIVAGDTWLDSQMLAALTALQSEGGE